MPFTRINLWSLNRIPVTLYVNESHGAYTVLVNKNGGPVGYDEFYQLHGDTWYRENLSIDPLVADQMEPFAADGLDFWGRVLGRQLPPSWDEWYN